MSCNIVILQSFSRILFCAMWYFFALISIMYDFVLSWSSYIFFLCLDRYIRAIAIDRRKRETEILARISDKKYCSLSYNLLTIPLEFPYFQALRKNKNGFRTRTFIEERSTSKYFFNRFPVLVLFIPFYFILFEKFQHNFFEFFIDEFHHRNVCVHKNQIADWVDQFSICFIIRNLCFSI